MRLQKFASLIFVLTAVAIFAAPAFRANGDNGGGLKSFQADCNQTAFVANSNIFTCTGNLFSTATLTESNFSVGTTLGTTATDDLCFLDSETLTITTGDGSTLTFETSGIQCKISNISFGRNNTYFITGGTGHFATVTAGAGNYVLSGSNVPNSNFFPSTIHLDGNILGAPSAS